MSDSKKTPETDISGSKMTPIKVVSDSKNTLIRDVSDRKKTPKGILKKSGAPSRDHNKSTTFDEMNIITTLHPADKDYGHIKIDEPPTPYNYEYEEGQAKTLDPNILTAKLAKSVNEPLKSSTEKQMPEDNLTLEEKERRKGFEERRKAHYREYVVAKAKAPVKVDTVVPTPGPSRSPNVMYCKDIPNCPGHKPDTEEKCDVSKVKGKMGPYTPRKKAGPS